MFLSRKALYFTTKKTTPDRCHSAQNQIEEQQIYLGSLVNGWFTYGENLVMPHLVRVPLVQKDRPCMDPSERRRLLDFLDEPVVLIHHLGEKIRAGHSLQHSSIRVRNQHRIRPAFLVARLSYL